MLKRNFLRNCYDSKKSMLEFREPVSQKVPLKHVYIDGDIYIFKNQFDDVQAENKCREKIDTSQNVHPDMEKLKEDRIKMCIIDLKVNFNFQTFE